MSEQETLISMDEHTGVLECPYCKELEDVVLGLERDIRAWTTRYAKLKQDKDAEAEASPHWREFLEVMEYWRRKTKHKGYSSHDRYELIFPFLKKDGVEMCKRAIDGAAYDPFTTERKNGTKKKHDGIELIFRDRGKFEEFVCRAPKEK